MPGTLESRVAQLHRFGQSPWFDYISRPLVTRGGLRRLVDEDGLGGVTSNPAIFEKAVGAGHDYDDQILALSAEGLDAPAIFDRLAVDDVRAACDVLAPVFLASGGEDGFVSIEVSPAAADDTELSISEAHRLFAAVDRPNVMVKIPGTRAGVPAILQCLKDGLNINITLLFSLTQYEAVAEAYLEALEWRLQHDHTMRAVSSVASFFVSRVDTLVDALLDQRLEGAADAAERRRLEDLKGKAGVANSKVVYERFRSYLNARDWQLLAASGAKVQRVLWASTGTKNPAYPDVLYVDELIGEHTVNTHAGGHVERVQGPRLAGAHRRPAPRRGPPALRALSHAGHRHGAGRRPAAGGGRRRLPRVVRGRRRHGGPPPRGAVAARRRPEWKGACDFKEAVAPAPADAGGRRRRHAPLGGRHDAVEAGRRGAPARHRRQPRLARASLEEVRDQIDGLDDVRRRACAPTATAPRYCSAWAARAWRRRSCPSPSARSRAISS